MDVCRAASAKHQISGFAILAAFLVCGAASEASAQVDENLQSRLTTFSPPITVLRPEISSEAGTREKAEADKTCQLIKDPRLADLGRADRAAQIHNKALAASKNSLSAAGEGKVTRQYFIKRPEGIVDNEKISQDMQRPEVQEYSKANPAERFRIKSLISYPIAFKCGAPQPRAVKFSFPFNPTYETNVLKSDANVHSDTSLGFGGSILVTGPGLEGRPYDVVGFSASSASARYSDFGSKSFDALTEQGIYQIYLGAHHLDGTPIDVKREEVANLLTIDTLALGIVNQTAFMSGYHGETADLFTPQFTLARQNMALSGNICATPSVAGDAKPLDPSKAPSNVKGLGFCYYLDLALTAGQTFSDVTTQQNVNVAGSVTPGWRIDNSNWNITLPMVATVKDYENVVGGRRDVLFQIGPAAAYSLPSKPGAPSLTFSLAATYNRNYSTQSTAAWHGYIVQPTLTIAFQPPTAVKPDPAK